MFSDSAISGAKPGAKARKVFDRGKGAEPGLFVVVPPAGSNRSKLWRLRYWHAGKERLLALGSFPSLSLANARAAARNARKLIDVGADPIEHRRAQEAARKRLDAQRVEVYAKRWLDDGAWIDATLRQYRRHVERDVLPALGDRLVTELTPATINELVRAAAKKRTTKDVKGRRKVLGGVRAARTLRLVLAGILELAVDEGAINGNPAARRPSRGKSKSKTETHKPKPFRHLNVEQLADFLRRLDEYKGDATTIAALQLLALCFTRPSELREAQWREFHLEAVGGPIWNVPGERMKSREPHDVPLSKQAVAVLDQLKSISGKRRHLFPNIRDAGRPMGRSTLQRALEYLGADGSPHGFRHTASTVLHEQGFDTLVIERQLAHADRNATRAAYNKARFLPERRRMLQHWADFLDHIKTGDAGESNVVPVNFGGRN